MNKADLERAAKWLDERAELCNGLHKAALEAAAFEMREEAARGIFIEPLSLDHNTKDFFAALNAEGSDYCKCGFNTGARRRSEMPVLEIHEAHELHAPTCPRLNETKPRYPVSIVIAESDKCQHGQEGFCFKCGGK